MKTCLALVAGSLLSLLLGGCAAVESAPVSPDAEMTTEPRVSVVDRSQAFVPAPVVAAPRQNEPEVGIRAQQGSPQIGLQLGAFADPAGASRAASRLRTAYPELFQQRTLIIRTLTKNGAQLHKLILGPFTDQATARQACQRLQARGEGCFPAQFDRVEISSAP